MITEAVLSEPIKEVVEKPQVKKKENLKQRAYLNTLSSLIDYVANRLTGLFVNPFIVGGLGTTLFGTWQMLGQLTGYINIADTRSSQVLKWSVAQKKDTATVEELRQDTAAAFVVLLVVVPVILIAGAIISWYAPYITHAQPEYFNLIRIACALMNFAILVFKLFELFEAVLRGMNLSFKRMGLRAGIVIIGGGLKILVITMGYGLIGLAAVQILVSLLIGISFYIVVKRSVEWFGFAKPKRENVMRFGKLSAWYLADAGANVVSSNSDKLLLGIITGPVAVAYYTLTKFIPVAIQGLVNRLILGIMPGVGKLLGLKEYDKINNVRKTIFNVTLLMITACGVTIIAFNNSFVDAWIGKGHFAGNYANAAIMLMIMQDTFIKNDSYIINASLNIRKKVLLTFLSAAVFVAAGFLLIGKMGITGLCISLMAGRLILFAGQRKILADLMQKKARSPFIQNIRPVLICLIMLAVSVWLATQIRPVSLYHLLLYVPATFLVSFFIFYKTGLSQASRQELRHIISSIKFFKSDSGANKK